jgi:hypothetical protein
VSREDSKFGDKGPMRSRGLLGWLVLIAFTTTTSWGAVGQPVSAPAQPEISCVKHFFERSADDPVEPTAADAETVIVQVATSLGLRPGVVVIPCNLVSKAQAYVPRQQDGIPPGEYIIYDPDWYREVIGRERMQGIWVFGHELAHILNRDFTVRRDVSPLERETSADLFAGCAVAKMKGDVKTLEDIVYKMRREKEGVSGYPDRAVSLAASRSGYDLCGGVQPAAPVSPQPQPTVSYKICSGEYENRCQAHDVYLYCYADVSAWAKARCNSYTIQRLNTYGGNKCGYSIDSVICTGPR